MECQTVLKQWLIAPNQKGCSIDSFLDRIPRKDYNCLDFVREVWLFLRGEDITELLTKLVGDFANRRVNLSGIKTAARRRLRAPVSPCFVVMQRQRFVPHVGIYLNGRVLHLAETGVEFQPLNIALRYYKTCRFYQ